MERNRSDDKKRRTPSGAAVKRPALTEALCRALFEEWARTGYAALSLERVAARAGAGKAAIYRRWPSKREFAGEAVATMAMDLARVPDEDSLEKDILVFLKMLRRVLRHPLVRRILPDLHAERARSDELAPVLDRVAEARRRRGLEMLERAIARGELPSDLDRDLALDLLPSPLYWRIVVTDRPITMAELRRQAHVLAVGLGAAGKMEN